MQTVYVQLVVKSNTFETVRAAFVHSGIPSHLFFRHCKDIEIIFQFTITTCLIISKHAAIFSF